MQARLITGNGLGLSIVEGCLATLPQTFTTGVFLTGFALVLGADTWALGVVAAIAAVAQAGQLLAPPLLARGEARKALTIWAASFSRYLWVAIAALPFLPLAPDARLAVFFGLFALASAAAQLAGVAWTDWMADMVPSASRGRYFGVRNALAAATGLVLTTLGTAYLDLVDAGTKATAFAGLIGLAMVASVASQGALMAQPGPPPRPAREGRAWAGLVAPLRDRRFRRFALRFWGFMFVVGTTSPFVLAYALQELLVGYALLGMTLSLTTGLSIASQPWWGRVIDRLGAQKALVMCIVPIALHPLYWMAMTPQQTWPLWVDAVSSGLFWPAVTLASMALMMETAPAADRAAYVAIFNAGQGLAMGVAALVGGALLTWLAAAGPLPGGLGAFQLVLLGAMVARTGLVVALWRQPRLAAAPTITIETRVADVPPPPADVRAAEFTST